MESVLESSGLQSYRLPEYHQALRFNARAIHFEQDAQDGGNQKVAQSRGGDLYNGNNLYLKSQANAVAECWTNRSVPC